MENILPVIHSVSEVLQTKLFSAELQILEQKLTLINFIGGNCHVLLKASAGEKVNHGIPNDDLPRLVTSLFDLIEIQIQNEYFR